MLLLRHRPQPHPWKLVARLVPAIGAIGVVLHPAESAPASRVNEYAWALLRTVGKAGRGPRDSHNPDSAGRARAGVVFCSTGFPGESVPVAERLSGKSGSPEKHHAGPGLPAESGL